MPRIPTQDGKKFSVPNTSDLFGNIQYTKNMNFDDEGYLKLSSRTVNIVDRRDDNDMGIPISFGRLFLTDFYNFLVTSINPFKTLTSPSGGFSGTEDTDTSHPANSSQSTGIWWRNLWHVTTDTGLYYKNPSTGVWTNTGVSLTAGVIHSMTVFRSKPLSAGQLCVSNGNTVLLLDSSYATIITLTIPTDYEIVDMEYNNQSVGIITRLAVAAKGQNQEAYFFVWKGAASSADSGFSVGSDTSIGITAYQSSWAILNRAGQLRFWTGGGWQELGQFPFFHSGLSWGDSYNRESFGKMMITENDLIYINVNNKFNQFGTKYEQYVQHMPGGIWCYDPRVGIYQRYSPSITKASFINVPQANVNTTTNMMTASSGTLPATGNPIKVMYPFSTVGGLKVSRVYYIIRVDATRFQLALTKEDAINAIAIDLTSTGSTNNYFLALTLLDYGASAIDRTGGIGLMGQQNTAFDHIIFGEELRQYDSTTDYFGACLSISEFKNIGFLVSSKYMSQNIEDENRKLYIKHKPLDTGDEIIAKYADIEIMGLPVTTPQGGLGCTWTSDTVFTTAADLSEAYAYLNDDDENELECEIIGGAGAGQMSQIESISYSAPTYTVTLSDSIEGATNTYICDIIIYNWKLLLTADGDASINVDNDKGWMEFPITSVSKWIKYKIECRGKRVTLEEAIPVNSQQQLPI